VRNEDASLTKASAPNAAGDDRPRDDTRQRILESARRLVQRDGLPALTVGAVAAEAGVYKAAVSYHFGGKAGLMASLVTASFDEIDERIAAAARACPPGRERVRFIVEHWLDFISPDVDLVFFDVLGYVLRKKAMHEQLQGLYQRWTDGIFALLLEGPDTQVQTARQMALLLRMLIDGMAIERLVNPNRSDWKAASRGLEEMMNLYAGSSGEDMETD
jgi:AcrR family transcriptional regulator